MTTKAEAIMALACALAGEDISHKYGKTTANAIDALADTLAGTDVKERAVVSDAVSVLGGQVEGITSSVKRLNAALTDAGIDTGSGSLVDVIDAVVGGVESGELVGEFADNATDIDSLFNN